MSEGVRKHTDSYRALLVKRLYTGPRLDAVTESPQSEKRWPDDPCRHEVRVAVETPDRPEASYLRCSAVATEGLRAAALSGGRFARHAVDRRRFGIEVVEIAGALDDPAAEEGAVFAATYAVWRAHGYRWSEEESQAMAGWSLREADA